LGTVVWFTGLPGAGKTTVASLVAAALEARGLDVRHLDGDRVRADMTRDLGFTRADRDANVARVAAAAADFSAEGGVALVSLISPYAAARAQARSRGWSGEAATTSPVFTIRSGRRVVLTQDAIWRRFTVVTPPR